MSLAKLTYHGIDIELSLYPSTGEPVYTLYRDGYQIPCMTPAQERTYPKVAAWIGTGLVEGYKAARQQEAAR